MKKNQLVLILVAVEHCLLPVARLALIFVVLFGLARISSAGVTGGFSVNINSREEVRSFYNGVYLSSEGVPINSSAVVATCTPGTNSTAFRESVLRRVNWLRALAGMPSSVTFESSRNASAQQGALMLAANDSLTHTPPSTWACWTSAGSNAAFHANIAWFANGPQAIVNYINESGSAGHRRWVLYPNTQVMGTGDMPAQSPHEAANVLWVFDGGGALPRPATRNSFVSWPPPGYTPYQVAFSAWSFAYTNADFTAATVTMRSNNVAISSVALQPLAYNMGEDTLVWEPANFFTGRPVADIVYSVSISNVLINGGSSNFNYAVTVFDPATPGPDTHPPTIAGPAQPTVGQNNAYAFTAVSNATSYQWRQIYRPAFNLTDGAENGLGNFIVGMTTNLYSPFASDIFASGTRAFHFCHPEFTDQTLTFTNLFYAATNSVLTFKSRLTTAMSAQFAKVQASVDDGATWTDLYSQAGTGGSGESAFVNRTVSLSSLAGSSVRLRFNYTFQIFVYAQTTSGFGWYVDDIVLTNIEQMVAPVITSTATTNFTFNPAQAGNYNLDVRPLIYTDFPLEWGPAKLVTAIGGGALPTAITLAATAVATNGATLNGSGVPNGNATSGYFVWGTNTSYGTTSAPVSLGNGSGAVAFSTTLSGLVAGRTYRYRAVASNSVSIAYGSDMTFISTSPVLPAVTTVAASGIMTTAATLNGSANPSGSEAIGFFQWGTTASYGQTTVSTALGTGSNAVSFSKALSGLVSGQTYHYRAAASNVAGVVYGNDMSFTNTTVTVGPSATTLAATGVTINFATLNGSVDPNGPATIGFFQWGTTTNYGQTTASLALGGGSGAVAFWTLVSGLVPGQTYHYRAGGSNVTAVVYGNDMTFTATTVPVGLSATTLAATAVTSNSATLNGAANPNGVTAIGFFQWGTTAGYGRTTPPVNLGSGNAPVAMSAPLVWLTAGVTYHFRAVASNSVDVVYGNDFTFTPPVTFSPPIGTFTGGDAGEGLDLQGNFPYAVNVGGNGAPGLIGNANFTTDTVPGVSVTAAGGVLNTLDTWAAPDFGATVNDDRLEQAMRSIRWTTEPAKLTVTLGALTAGRSYKLQLLFIESCCDRAFDVKVAGASVVAAFRPLDFGPFGTPLVVTHTFTSSGTNATIELGGGTVPAGLEGNSTLSAFTLEEIAPGVSAALTITRSGNNVVVSWPAGINGVLQQSPGIAPATWTNAASGATNPITLPATGAARFYRLLLLPTNDAFTNRTLLNGAPLTVSASNAAATKETGEPNHAGNNGGRSLWWAWTAPSTGPVTVTLAGSSFDTLLAVYTGLTLNGLTSVAANDDYNGNLFSRVTFTATQNVTYHIAVDGFNDGTGAAAGTIQLNLTMP